VSREFDVVIVGAGPVGSVMAALLVVRHLAAPGRVAVVAERIASSPAAIEAASAEAASAEAASAEAAGRGSSVRVPWDLRVFALSRASQRLLQLCGVWGHLPSAFRYPYERMCVWDASGAPQGRGSLTFDCAELGEPDLGFIVDGRALQESCVQAAGAAGAVLIEAGLQSVEATEPGVRIVLGDGREIGARLVIAADGAGSKTRELLGIATAGHAYHQDALVAHVRTAEPHRGTAWQRFLPTGPLAFLPLSDGRSSIVWSVIREEADRLRALDAQGFAAAVLGASGGVLGDIELTTPVARFPIHLQYALDYVRPRAVLVGDAAHAVHPMAGQGLNLGLLDCASLAEALGEAGAAGTLGDQGPLRRYERRRKSENLITAAALDGLERLFSSSNPGVARLRTAGLGAVGSLAFVKRRLARRALGIHGDVPAFVRAQSF
jgi:2-octaprenylphenol hydroxylase